MDQFIRKQTNIREANDKPLSAPSYERGYAEAQPERDQSSSQGAQSSGPWARASALGERAREAIRKHPLRATGGAFAIGVAVGGLTPSFLIRRAVGAGIGVLAHAAIDQFIPRLH